MKTIHRRRFIRILIGMMAIFSATILILYAMQKSVSLYFTPVQLANEKINKNQQIHIGGNVLVNSVSVIKNNCVRFALGDHLHHVWVEYSGILPGLFHVKQMVVVHGQFNSQGIFQADQVLAKHDENYHPSMSGKEK